LLKPVQRQRGLLLAVLLTAVVVIARHYQERVDYWHAHLPNFDSYVFAAMAENPAYFTVAPWGYRLLHPWMVGTLPARFLVRGFEGVCFGFLAITGGLLFVFLRRLGHSELASVAGVAAFALSPPVAEAVRVPFLGEPVALATQLAFVAALESGAGVGVLGLLLAVAAFAKESVLLLVPAVFLVRRAREGTRRAIASALLAGLPAAAIMLVLRFVWTPYVHIPTPALDLELLRSAVQVLRQTWAPTASALLLAGILPLAVLGALRRRARPYLARYGYLAAVMIAVSLTAWVNIPSPRAVPLFSANTLRVLIYALPFLIPLALIALDRVWPNLGQPSPPRPTPRRLDAACAVASIALVLLPVLALDRYRRAPLYETRDGPLVRTAAQETLRTARRLQRGETVSFDPAVQRFAWGAFDAAEASRMRWFLRGGWGALAHYGTGDIAMHDAQAVLLLPVLVPRDLEVRLTLEAPDQRRLRAFVNGQPVGALAAGPGPVETRLRVPATLLFRGDNVLTLAAEGGAVQGVKLRRYVLRPPS
jgi:hypothetical protein